MTDTNEPARTQRGFDFGVRYFAPALFIAWLILIYANPSPWLMFIGVSWVVYYRTNLMAQQVKDALVVLHRDNKADRLDCAAMLLLAIRPHDASTEVIADRLAANANVLRQGLEPDWSDPDAENGG